ncbi:unnamed protein product [Rotaria magnacalcarata]|uniref:Uncharacterized protein n=1 Tax=Rotaria magnacalcarata TaxID=392030 RepID=A0A814ZIW1_9BILA|nr:unnamed protein product [Rotaria magnacalcarata]CAF4921438.1 unnamed protein product [Rotaria magnacalcarata]
MGKLDGKIALITGASEGIGLATAQQFIIEGAEHVFITGRRQHVIDEAVKTIGSKHVTAVQGDVSNMGDLDRLFSIILKDKGRLDILFANAGIVVLFTVQEALPLLADGASVILNGSSVSIKAAPMGSGIKEIWKYAGLSEEEAEKVINSSKAVVPMNRMGMPDEVAKAAVFLASDDSSYVTGIELFVDGGMTQI